MLDITKEEPIRLEQIAAHLKVHVSTVYRWCLKGTRSPSGALVHLEALRVGSRWVSSLAAVERFAERTTPNVAEPAATPRSASRRQRASELAASRLEKLGL
jgi:hypothetical protein